MVKRLLLASIMALKIATPENLIDETEIYDTELPEFDTASDRSLTESLKDILLSLGIGKSEEEEPEDILYTYESPQLRTAHENSRTYRNVVIYTGTFGNDECKLIIPYSSMASLVVIDGYLTNVGSSSVNGRMLFNDDVLDPDDYDTYSYILQPVYGNPSNVYNYGSFNYQRHYYLGAQNRIVSTDTYGKFFVDDIQICYSSSERTYYTLLVIILLLGVFTVWNRH